jgi:hypothetical protein
MKGGIFNRPECCNQSCNCPVCLENKPLMRLNCDHYVCLEDIQDIINLNPRRLQKCPICRELINNYGCNDNIINVANNQEPNIIPYEEYEEGLTDGEETDDEIYGGKRKTNRTHKKRNIHKKRKTKRARKNAKKNKGRKTKSRRFKSPKKM